MQSKTSFFSKAIFLKNLTRSWPVAVSMGFIYFLGLPMQVMVENSMFRYEDVPLSMANSILYISRLSDFMNPVFESVFAIVAVLIVFSYMFNNRASNTIHSLPVSRKSLYITGLISVICVLAIPQVLTCLLMLILGLAKGVTTLSYVFIWLFVKLGYDVFFAGFAGLVAMISGQAATTAIFYGLFNFLYISMEICVRIFAAIIYAGMTDIVSEININAISPIIYLTQKVTLDYDYTMDEAGTSILAFTHGFEGGMLVFIYVIAGIVLAALGLFAYEKKKLETVSDFISIGFMKHVFLVGMTFFPSLIFGALWAAIFSEQGLVKGTRSANICLWAFTLISGVIVYYVCQMLIAKSFRVFNKKNLIYLCCYSIGVMVFFGAMAIDALGIEKAQPRADDIEWVAIDCGYQALYRSPEDITTVSQIHSDLLANVDLLRELKYREDLADSSGFNVRLDYKLKNGRRIVRNYYLENSDDMPANYIEALSNMETFANNPENIKKNFIAEDYDTLTVERFYISKIEPGGPYGIISTSMNLTLTQEEKDTLYQAFLKDIDEGHMPLYCTDKDRYQEYLYNDISFELSREEGRPSVQSLLYNYSENEKEVYIYPSLTKECTNIINTLLELGIIQSEDDLYTNKQISELEEEINY